MDKLMQENNISAKSTISVCLASYNGEKYIENQLHSILVQLSCFDEVIVSDDFSTDRTIEIIDSMKDDRIRLLKNKKNKSPIYNFENALNNVTGDIVFLSDQDDVWMPDKIKVTLEYLKQYDLVVSDATLIDADGTVTTDSFYELYGSGAGLFKNLYRNRFLGCTMAFNRRLLEYALPFPSDIPMHDMWLGLVCEVFGKTKFIDNKLIYYRRHPDTVTTGKHASTFRMLCWRYSLIKNLVLRYFAVKNGVN